MHISVYGTLRKGQRANYMLDRTTFIGESVEELPLKMYHLGGFPALALDKNKKNRIVLETYEIKENDNQTINQLDRYEGYPHLYEKLQIVLKSGIETTVYYMVGDGALRGSIIETGDWCNQRVQEEA